MTFVHNRYLFAATVVSILLHWLLIWAVQPMSRKGCRGVLVPPKTHYQKQAGGQSSLTGNEVRTLWSPVLFSLPSTMGFSRELKNHDVRTRLTFTQQSKTEHFLDGSGIEQRSRDRLTSEELMLTTPGSSAPRIPGNMFIAQEKRPATRRVNISPELKERLVGGVVLPPSLNKEVSHPWNTQASVSVSEQGVVQHVFLETPLKSEALNHQVIQLLYSLRFKPGEVVEGSIELYSPVTQMDNAESQ